MGIQYFHSIRWLFSLSFECRCSLLDEFSFWISNRWDSCILLSISRVNLLSKVQVVLVSRKKILKRHWGTPDLTWEFSYSMTLLIFTPLFVIIDFFSSDFDDKIENHKVHIIFYNQIRFLLLRMSFWEHWLSLQTLNIMEILLNLIRCVEKKILCRLHHTRQLPWIRRETRKKISCYFPRKRNKLTWHHRTT